MLPRFKRRFSALAALSLACSVLQPAIGVADGAAPTDNPAGCMVDGDIVYLSGLILQGAENSFYLWADAPACVSGTGDAGEKSVVHSQLIELRCYDDGWNNHQRRRGETLQFRGEIGAIEPDRVVLSCHMPL
ncbi:hypothetical protein [Rhizobium sp. NFR12]|uniref:hypothetical protein n=1 Tax=Rhizobium sp. NFR12 TaxID=1566261 RepID=UPI0008A7AD5B|nr:hypothetical protein [Rhizobium sp. NFR12]SEH31055.1 hypothetical protein SAMN03159407_4255 [Rhizobium sp. NFR12]